MSNDVAKTPKGLAPAAPTQDAASRLKHSLMADALERTFGKETEKPIAPGTPRVLLALGNYALSRGWDRAKALQRELFEAAAGTGLEMKFAFYGPDNAAGVRRCRITTRWIGAPDDMAGVMDRAKCDCGCYLNIRDVLAQAVKEAKERALRAVVIVGDVFHDDEDGLYQAATSAHELRRAGTKVILLQQGDHPITERKLEYLAKVSSCAFFRFDTKTQQQQFAEMWHAVSVFTAGGEEAVKTRGGQAATLLLQHLKQEPMPIIERRDRVRVDSDIKE